MPIYPSTWSNTGNQFYYIFCTYLISMNNYGYHDCLCNIYTIITLVCIHSHICSFILRFSYFSIIHIMLAFTHSYIHIPIHFYICTFIYFLYLSCVHLSCLIILFFSSIFLYHIKSTYVAISCLYLLTVFPYF